MSGYEGAPDLTLPSPASLAARQAFSGALRERTRALLSLRLHEIRGGDAVRAAIVSVFQKNAAAVFAAMRRTSVHVHFEAAKTGDRALHLGRGCATLLVELAAMGALERSVTMAMPERVVLRSQRRTVDVRGLSGIDAGAIASAPSEATHPVIEDDITLALYDDNPLAMNEAHPDKEGNALSLGGHDVEAWIASLRDCLARIGTYLPELRGEMGLGLQQVVPVGYDDHKHLSASYREALGTVYLTLHPDPMTMTEAVIHEFQHNKLNAALDLDPFLENAFTETVVSPVRPDPRPLHGVLLAVHAFQPVAELYRRMIEANDPLAAHPRFADRLAKIHRGNHEGLSTLLAHARATAAGARVLEEMQALDARHATPPAGA